MELSAFAKKKMTAVIFLFLAILVDQHRVKTIGIGEAAVLPTVD